MLGYKLSDVGVIPEDWEVKRLADLSRIATGSTPPTSDQSNYSDDYLFVSPVDLGKSKYVTKTEKSVSKKGFFICRNFPRDSILFVCIGSTIGKCGIAPCQLTSNQQINAIFPSSSFSTGYLYYALCMAAPRVGALAGQQAVPIINKTQFGESVVAFPPLTEQNVIAEGLSAVDELLEILETLIEKKRAIKQGTMQQLLTGRTRLPSFHEPWSSCYLATVIDFVNGKPYETYIDPDGHYDLITLDSIGIDGNLKSEHRRIGISDNSLSKDDIVIILSDLAHGNLLGLCDLIPEDNRYVLNQRVGRLRIKPGAKADPQFVRLQINRQQEHFKKRGQGTSQRHIYRRDIDQLQIALPKLNEQTAIVQALSSMGAEIAALEARRNKTRAIKQGMMQQLLTGRIRLVKPQPAEARA